MRRDKLDILCCATETPARGGTVRAGALMGFGELVAKMGADPERMISSCGLAPDALGRPDNIIPFGAGSRLLQLAKEELSCPHFGLLLGQRQNLALLGPIGFLVQHSADVRSALVNLVRYMHLHVEGASARLVVKSKLAGLSYHILIPGIAGTEQVYAICMANEYRFLKILCGGDWLPSAVHFCFRTPRDDAPFRKFFGAPVYFNQPESAVFFPAHYLDRKIPSADSGLGEILQKYVEQIESRRAGDLVGQLRSVVRTLLATGDCTADRVAALFSMHRRTLHRQLGARGATFEQVVDSVRHELAMQMLEHSDMKLGRLAGMLGYSELSSFNRAFRRWAGTSPSDWRDERRWQPGSEPS